MKIIIENIKEKGTVGGNHQTIALVRFKGARVDRRAFVNFKTDEGEEGFHRRLRHRMLQMANLEPSLERSELQAKIKVDTGVKKKDKDVVGELWSMLGQEITL